MFLMIGVTEGRKDLAYDRMVVCGSCGSYGRYQVFMTFTQLLLFFIPCFRWNRRYFVRMSCCGTVWELDPEVGRQIAGGENVEIRESDLRLQYSADRPSIKICAHCGYKTGEDFSYCPICGQKL